MWTAYIYDGHEVEKEPRLFLTARNLRELKNWLKLNVHAARMLWHDDENYVDVLLGKR